MAHIGSWLPQNFNIPPVQKKYLFVLGRCGVVTTTNYNNKKKRKKILMKKEVTTQLTEGQQEGQVNRENHEDESILENMCCCGLVGCASPRLKKSKWSDLNLVR